MAYVQAQSSHRRTKTLIAVAGLHAAAIYALMAGLSVDGVQQIITRLEGRNIPVPKPSEPPPPEPAPAIDQTQIFVPKPMIDVIPKQSGAPVIDLIPIPQPTTQPSGADPGPLLLPSPTPSAGFTPRGATPLGSPGRWVSSDDYPASELRLEHEGVTRFRVTVGADGRVRNCEVTASSGFAELDRATCANVSKRARFKPATDATGAVDGGSYSSAVTWEIPD